MKKQYLVLLITFFLNQLVFAQEFISKEFTPIKSPEAASFVNLNFMPLDEYTGKGNISIPLYSIDLDGLEIPISISYDTGGVKVNGTSSNVGLNWSLNAGGLINKEVLGLNDMASQFVMNSEYSTSGGAYIQYGFLRHLLYYADGYPIATAGIDNQPDQYSVYAPGLTTKFIHRYNGTPLEIYKGNNLIYSPFTDSGFLFQPFINININSAYMYSKLNFRTAEGFKFGFKIINSSGFEYSFYDTEKSISFYRNLLRSVALSEVPAVPFNPNSTSDIDRDINTYSQVPIIGRHSVDAFPIIKLSRIKNPVSKREVQFVYEDNRIVDNNQHFDAGSYCLENYASNDDMVNFYEHDINIEKLLKSIVFPDGQVLFYYDSNRLDLRGGKILKKIEVRNNDGVLVKGISFEQSYFAGISGCSDSFYCSRLRLDAICFFDKNNNKLPGYTFQYNNTPLPKRYAVDQDYLGFYNGPSNILTLDYKSKIYSKADQGKLSYLPFPFPGYTLVCDGNGSKVPNLMYSRAGCMDKVTYPTGGYTMFDYELNTFDLLGTEVSGGGLRLKQQSIFDNQNILQKKLNYNYNKIDGFTSGKIVNMPNFISASASGDASRVIYQNYNNVLELNSSSSYIGYSQVKIIELNNGYTINKYSNTSESPNVYPSPPSVLINPYNSVNYDSYFYKLNNGLLPSLFKDFSMKRGNLISTEIFSNNNSLIKSVFNEYEYKKYDEFPVSQNYTIVNRGQYVLNSEVYAKFDSSIDVQSNFLKKTTSNEYSNSGQTIDETVYSYYPDKPFLNGITKVESNGNIIKDTFFYPFDANVSGLANISTLNSLNVLKPIKEIKYDNSEIVGTYIHSYQNLGSNKIVPMDLQISKGNNTLDIIESYSKYDIKGNLIEYSKKDGTPNVVIYGYNYQYKIAVIIGANYNQVLAALGTVDVDVLQTKTNDELEIIFNNLRTALPNSLVYSYTHIPLVGLNSTTDPKGVVNYFEYDTFNRLSKTKDNERNIINDQKYNYTITPSSSTIFQEGLTLEIGKSAALDYVPYTSSPNFKEVLNAKVRGGKGNYSYEWTLSPSATVLSKSANFTIKIPCGTSNTYTLKVTDSNNASIMQNVTANAASCSEAFYAGAIEGTSAANNQYNFWINAEGGSFKFKYTWWFTATITTLGGSSTISNYCPNFLTNTGSISSTGTLYVEIKDLESGYTVQRSRVVTIYPEYQPPGSCFISGTKVTMSDGTSKKIEDVIVGDSILTYNIESKTIEIGKVENVVTPIHSQFIELQFDNNVMNTNTLDHPYYLKNKGWCSYNPKMTMSNYGLKVGKYKEGDIVLHYDDAKKRTDEIRIKKIKIILKEQKTYNLQKVSKNHDFFANGILVHNKNIK